MALCGTTAVLEFRCPPHRSNEAPSPLPLVATRADWQALTTFAKALTNEIQKAHKQGFATKEIEAAAQQSLKVFETIRLIAEAEADPQHPAFAQARNLARDLDKATDDLYDLTTWLNNLTSANQNTD